MRLWKELQARKLLGGAQEYRHRQEPTDFSPGDLRESKSYVEWMRDVNQDPVKKQAWSDFQKAAKDAGMTQGQYERVLHDMLQAHLTPGTATELTPITKEKIESLIALRQRMRSTLSSESSDQKKTNQFIKTQTKNLADKKVLGTTETPLVMKRTDLMHAPADGKQIISMVSETPKLKELYSKDVGASEKYTLEQHTRMVYEVFDKYENTSGIKEIKTSDGVDLESLMKVTIALHEIGKPLAVEAGNKNRQHEFTVPIMKEYLGSHGYSKREIEVATALVDNDVLGDLVKGAIIPNVAYEKIVALAEQAHMSPADYFKAQSFFLLY